VIKHLREVIEVEHHTNALFQQKADAFLENCHKVISRDLTFDDVREMIIQHILTEDIFHIIFNDADFHRENNIARELTDLIQTFFKKDLKRNALDKIHHYYDTIRITAAAIDDHGQKQDFLKTIYEEFYKAYSPQKADKQGIVYTPIEVVRFMIAACDHLLHEHFNKTLASKNVEILDPCTGTGVFITEMLRHMEGQPKNLAHKYEHEIHCNEMDLLPYYIANLNIEYIYKQITGEYREYPNICLVDTLDNVAFDKRDLFSVAGFSEENLERVKRQNQKKISVIIGNPPYNANQQSENDNNKNREYREIDARIKDTYIKQSTAQKTKQYDMYKRFIRWASDRIQDDGVVAFITNNAFLDAKQDDGFRKVAAEEFSEIYSINLRGEARGSGEIRRKEGGNIFENKIRVGAAISFFVKRKEHKGKCKLFVYTIDDFLSHREKRNFVQSHRFKNIEFERYVLDKKNNWIDVNQEHTDFDSLLPLISKEVKAKTLGSKMSGEANVLFKLSSLGVVTARDEWVYDFNAENLRQKMAYFLKIYETERKRHRKKKLGRELDDALDYSIKWTRRVKKSLSISERHTFSETHLRTASFRPFVDKHLYFYKTFNEEQYRLAHFFPSAKTKNVMLCINVKGSHFNCLASDKLVDYHLNGDASCLALHYYSKYGTRLDNITDWGLAQFQSHYADATITKEAIFHYVYGVLNNPAYREKYADNLKTEYPRIPFYDDFQQWAAWGKALMDLHVGYAQVTPYQGITLTHPSTKEVPLLKLNTHEGMVILDEAHVITGIPHEAFAYMLGSRSPIEWVLTGYKPKKYNPDKEEHHKILAAEFNHYDWPAIRATLLDLIPRLITISIETCTILEAMRQKTH
jgi:predicted helicase